MGFLSRRRPDPYTARWVDDVDALALAFVRGPGFERVAEVLRLDGATRHDATFRQAEGEHDFEAERYAVQYERAGEWHVLVEPNGYQTSLPETAAALSAGGEAVGVFWNVNAQMRFLLARDGAVVRTFDPLLPEDQEGEPLPEEDGLPFGADGPNPRLLALALAERLTGIMVTGEWLLAAPRATWLTR